ncbi:MAG: membrane dipeptidase [Candidatus Sericytochromatia bacterium]|nr:MAG: membrane dipeptidase [Candidatus Sericytochromatia bacterium]
MIYKNTYIDFSLLWQKRLKVSKEALEIYCSSDVIDAHTDTYIWKRLINYDLTKKHKKSLFSFNNQFDYPKCIKSGITGVVMDIVTNPFIRDNNKFSSLRNNINIILKDLNSLNNYFSFVRNYNEYLQARKNNKIAVWLSIQGGNSLSELNEIDFIPEIHRITLVHLTNNKIGKSSLSFNQYEGLSKYGKNYIDKMIDNKILIDLSHINKGAFYDIDKYIPKSNTLVVTHTGVNGVRKSWRNLDDDQIKIIAKRNGFIGIIFERNFLSYNPFKCSSNDIIKHIEYVINLVGDDFVGLGSDYDGMITLPRDFKDVTYQPILVQKMLEKRWSIERIKKILGKNFLRVVKDFNS